MKTYLTAFAIGMAVTAAQADIILANWAGLESSPGTGSVQLSTDGLTPILGSSMLNFI
ncbi:MAG: hypothetical protein H8D93_01065 [Verrucomicrobia bacterium]|nr:hypothetical protein [Verrucomicrobiota bacterium]